MKSTQFATLLFSALLALLAGCATAEPEIESPADITVSELEVLAITGYPLPTM